MKDQVSLVEEPKGWHWNITVGAVDLMKEVVEDTVSISGIRCESLRPDVAALGQKVVEVLLDEESLVVQM